MWDSHDTGTGPARLHLHVHRPRRLPPPPNASPSERAATGSPSSPASSRPNTSKPWWRRAPRCAPTTPTGPPNASARPRNCGKTRPSRIPMPLRYSAPPTAWKNATTSPRTSPMRGEPARRRHSTVRAPPTEHVRTRPGGAPARPAHGHHHRSGHLGRARSAQWERPPWPCTGPTRCVGAAGAAGPEPGPEHCSRLVGLGLCRRTRTWPQGPCTAIAQERP